jgi:hypothetical protein
VREVELRAVEKRERERKAEQEAAQREREWQAARARALELYTEHHRGELLREHAARWREAEAIRTYCDAAQAAYGDDARALEWIRWSRNYANQVDPLRAPPRIPEVPELVSPEELRPFLDGWDPYGPHRRRW